MAQFRPARKRMTDWNRFREITALRDSGHPAKALIALQGLRKGATESADVSSILLAESIAHRDLGQFDKAAEAASKAIELLPRESPSRPYAEFSLACIHESEGKFDLAVQGFKTLLKEHTELLSTSEYVQFRRGVQLRLIANLIVLGQGVEPLSIADGLKTENISAEERAELSYREAQAHGLLGRHDKSLKLYEDAVAGPLERSLAARAHFHIGEVLYDRGELSRALEAFKNAEALAESSNPDRELFTKWIKHTRQALAGSRSQ
jgi:tetratricopeptide (TPR) repeat protein